MKNIRPLLLIAAMALAAAPAKAETIDLSTMKCSDYLQSGQDNIALIATWLIGLYTEMADRPVIDMARLRENSEKLTSFCKKNPNFTVATAADGILGD